MIPNYISFLHSKARGMYAKKFVFVCLFGLVFLFPGFIFPQATSETKELDQILREELGVPTNDSGKIESNKSNTKPNSNSKNQETQSAEQEINPVQDRYLNKDSDSPSPTWILLKILTVLGILMGTGYFLVLKLSKSRDARYPLKGFMRVMSSISLSPGQNLQIVEVGNRFFVLGLADGGVSLISEITDPEEKSKIKKSSEDADPYQPNFLEVALEALANTRKKIRIDKNKLEMQAGDSLIEWQKKSQDNLERLRKQRKVIEEGGT